MDPGPAFYPLVLLFCGSPVALIGLIVGVASWRQLSPDRRFAFSALLLFVGLFTVAMTLAAKKHTRYLLPALPPLTLAAVLGTDKPMTRFISKPLQRDATAPRLFPWLLLLPQAVIAFGFSAYPLTYQNPLLGGPLLASRVIPTGWGEGFGAAALRLNSLSHADQLTVATSSVPSFAPLFRGQTLPATSDGVPLADYVVTDSVADHGHDLAASFSFNLPSRQQPTVVYTNTASLQQASYLSKQAGPDDLILLDAETPLRRHYRGSARLLSAALVPTERELAAWLAQQMPGHDTIWLVASSAASPITAEHLRRQLDLTATLVGADTVASATIVEFIPRPDSEVLHSLAPYRAAYAGQLALVDAATPRVTAWPAPLETVCRWQALDSPPSDYLVVIHLRDATHHSWATRESPVRNDVNFSTSAWSPDEWSDATYKLRLPPGIPPDRYTVELSLYDLASGAGLAATGPDGDFLGLRVPVSEVAVAPPTRPSRVVELNIGQDLDVHAGPLTLIGTNQIPTQAHSGDLLSLELFWEAAAAPRADYRVRFRLLGSDGNVNGETIFQLSPYSTSQWRVGDRFRSHYSLRIPPETLLGSHDLAINVLHESGSPLLRADSSLAPIEISPRARSFALPDIPHWLDVTFGGRIHLRGYALAPAEVDPGGKIPLTLYLQADGPTDRSYTLFVHLLNPHGDLIGQADVIPGNGAAPTTSWAKDQVIVQELELPVASDAQEGEHVIALGFYDAAYGERLPVAGTADFVLPQHRAVLPEEVTVRP
jgi:hypothetical protein